MLRGACSATVLVVVGIIGCSGGSSSGGVASVSCRQKADSDTDSDCKAQAGKPRKLDCDNESQTDSAIAVGCTRSDPGDSDVCCPLSVSGATSSTGGTTTVACRQKSDSDTDSECASQSGKPRKLDCDSDSQTDAALAAGCSRTGPGDSDVCCPTTVSGSTGTASSTDAGSTSCTSNYDGDWELTGTCGNTNCVVAQAGCFVSVACGNGAKLSGDIVGTSAKLTGTLSSSQSLTCTVSFAGTQSFSLTCNVCSGSGAKQ